MTPAARRHVLGSALRRFGAAGLLIGVAVGVVSANFAVEISKPSYVAEGTFLVPLAPRTLPDVIVTVPDPRPPTSYEAERLARNYAAVIANDQLLLKAIGDRLGRAPDDLAQEIAAVNLPSTSVIRVTYTATSEAEAEAYFAVMSELLTAPQSVTPNIPATTLIPLRLPEEVIAQPGVAPVAPFLGVVAGLLLGIGAAVMLERMLSQVRSAADIRVLADWPVFAFTRHSGDGRYETVVLRVLDSMPGVRQVAVVRTGVFSEEARVSLLRELRRAEARLRSAGRIPTKGPTVDWRFKGRIPDRDGSVERAVQDADAVLLVMPRGALLKPTTLAVQRLQDLAVGNVVVVLGLASRWLHLVAPRRQNSGTTGAENQAEPQPPKVGTRAR